MSSPGRQNRLSRSTGSFSDEEAVSLYNRLLANDPTASSELAEGFLTPLIHWLQKQNRRIAPELVCQAAEDAILNLIRKPSTFDPGKNLTLEKYLRMSAQGDLRNVLAKEKRKQGQEISWNVVELSDQRGKYLGKEDDPSLPLQVAEKMEELGQVVSAQIRQGLTEPELRVLDLMLQGERRTIRFAEAYGIAHLEPADQKRQIKRVKDKLQKRLDRKGKRNEGTS